VAVEPPPTPIVEKDLHERPAPVDEAVEVTILRIEGEAAGQPGERVE